MVFISVFDSDEHVVRYESWFEKHSVVFQSEVNLLRSLLPEGKGFEVGIGTGLFAQELGIRMGNDPSKAMLRVAQRRDLTTYQGKGNSIPFQDEYFDFVLMVTTLCFLDDVKGTLKECFRIIHPKGHILIGFVDKKSTLGQTYLAKKEKSLFYKEARFYSTREVLSLLEKSGFSVKKIRQTLFDDLKGITEIQEHKEGFGEGGFVGVLAER
ncbi:MAG: class I SAM-dependent methyltransferase [Candidatus Aminicenantaceae bacterium]